MRMWLAFGLLAAAPAQAALLVVNSEADTSDGVCDVAHCTLREAILAANSAADFDTLIDFAIPGGGTRTIVLVSPLPVVTKSLQMFGFSQPGAVAPTGPNFNHTIRLQLDGSLLPDTAAPIGIDANVAGQFANVAIEGIAFINFSRAQGDGIALRIRDGRAQIDSNHFGVAADGSTLAGNDLGIRVESQDSVDISLNLVSGNIDGIAGTAQDRDGELPTFIGGNRIGTNQAGNAARPNTRDGIRIESSCALPAVEFELAGNVVSGNGRDGIHLDGPAECNTLTGFGRIAANRIGLAATGTGALGNGRHGVFANLLAAAEGITLGSGPNSTFPEDRNTIGFNGGAGVHVPDGAGGVLIRENTFRGNTGLPIDIGDEGATPNDAGDADTGGNRRLNAPILGALREVSGGLQVRVWMDGSAEAVDYPVRIDFYALADGVLAWTQTDSVEGPNAPRNVAITLPGGTELVAMASDNVGATGGDVAANSSEFSAPALRAVFSDGFE